MNLNDVLAHFAGGQGGGNPKQTGYMWGSLYELMNRRSLLWAVHEYVPEIDRDKTQALQLFVDAMIRDHILDLYEGTFNEMVPKIPPSPPTIVKAKRLPAKPPVSRRKRYAVDAKTGEVKSIPLDPDHA